MIDFESAAENRRRIILEAVEHLSPQCRAAFTLKVFDGLSYREIAERLHISTAAVERHIARGLLQVHAYISKHYPQMKQ